jgi:hypothetical protein
MGETNSPSVAHVGYDISPLKRVKFNSREWRNIVTQRITYRFFHHAVIMGESQISIWNKSFYKLKSEYDLLIAIVYKFALMPRMLVQTKIVGAFDFYITRFDCIFWGRHIVNPFWGRNIVIPFWGKHIASPSGEAHC